MCKENFGNAGPMRRFDIHQLSASFKLIASRAHRQD
jgi:hypothetical protein